MTIAKYIAELLFDYECVVIPGLGGFIVNDKPAQVSHDTHYFKPPYREVMFNPVLRTNDGLLLNHVASQEGITYKEAKRKVEEFVNSCHAAMEDGQPVTFERIGVIRKDENDKYSFRQDDSINYNPDAFGLPAFVSPAVHRVTDEEKVRKTVAKVKPVIVAAGTKTKRVDRKAGSKQQKRKSKFRTPLYIVLLLLIAIMVGWGVSNQQTVRTYYADFGKRIPLFYRNPGNYIANNVELLPVKSLSESASDLWLIHLLKDDDAEVAPLADDDFTFKDSEALNAKKPSGNMAKENDADLSEVENGVTEPAVSTTPDSKETVVSELNNGHKNITATPKEEVVKPESNVELKTSEPASETSNISSDEEFRYYIIAGSFSNEANAQRLVSQLRDKGFHAVIAGTSQNGMTRVAYVGFNRFKQALQQLSIIRQQENPSAWIMKK